MEEELEQIDTTMVTFGSLIAISDFKDQDAYVFSDGFLKNQLVLRNFVHKNQKKKSSDGLENDSFFKCLFQVLPRVSDTAKNQCLKKIEETTQIQNTCSFDYKNRYQIRNIQEYLSQLINEYKQNIDAIEKSKNIKLTYHQPFQLLHVASGRFLACYENESIYENQNYLIKLDDYSSDMSVFTIVPAYTYQSHGEQDVNAGEMCAITRAMPIQNRYAYLSCSQMEISDIKHGVQQTHEHIFKREINASVEQSHSWKISLFQPHIPESSRNLRVGDCIWLYHSEAESNLSVLKIKPAVDKTNFTFYSYNLSEWLSLKNLCVSVIESESESTQGYQGSTNGLWQLESAELFQGGYVKFEQGYLLKNVSTGYYLCVQEQEVNRKLVRSFTLSQMRDKSAIFQFVDLKTQAHEKFVKGGSYSYILNVMYKSWVDFHQNQNMKYCPILKEFNEKTEHAVFKIHMATRNEVWEINFLLSCFRLLAKFLIVIQNGKFPGVEDFNQKKMYIQKFERVRICIEELDDFVNNKAYTTSAEQIYGEINSSRQKLMREQFYIDLLIKILDRIITKGELEFYQENKKTKIKGKTIFSPEYMLDSEIEQIEDEQTQNTKIQIINYITQKVELANSIYKFLGSVCKFNAENQKYTYDLIPYFQIQTKYLPLAVNSIIDIVSSNKQLLLKLSEGLKIDYNEDGDANQDQIKVLINLYDGDDYDDNDDDQMQIKQHAKITSKPVTLIQYFINLLWDEEALNNSYYLKFLRNVCSFKEQPLQLNQENLYKLYKINNNQRPKLGVETKAEESKFHDGTVRLSSKAGQLIIPKDCDKNSQSETSINQFLYIIEQLTFFSQVALGRNFFWKKELGAQFEKSFLFRNIWNERPIDPRYEDLQPCFANLALTLYIDQEPLKMKKAPQMCQLYSECDSAKDYKMFRSAVDGTQNIQELNTYNDLVQNLMGYYKKLKLKLKDIIEPPKNEQLGQELIVEEIGLDVLSHELILNSTLILDKIIKLQLMWVLDYSLADEETKIIAPQTMISEIVEILLYIFQYEKFELQFVRAHAQSLTERVQDKLKSKFDPMGLQASGFMNMFSNKKKAEEDTDEIRGESQIMNEQHIYLNPIMRGFLKIQSKMQTFNYMDPTYIFNEVQLKCKICDIFEYLLDLRQDFMMQNVLVFFKYYIQLGDHIENNEILMRQKLHRENKQKKKDRVHYDKLRRKDLNRMIIHRMLLLHQKGLLPNIAKTGIKSIDEMKTTQSSFKINFMKSPQEEKPKKQFYNYINEQNLQGIPEILDLDQYLSINLGDTKPQTDPIASLLPTLLNSFTLITDKGLEKRCLSVILKLFTQKERFKLNLKSLQVIFDSEKTVLYKFLQKKMEVFQKLIDRIDSWMEIFMYSTQCEEFNQCYELLKSFNFGLMTDISQQDDDVLIAEDTTIDPQKQQLYANLDCYLKIINFLKDGMPYFADCLMDMEISQLKKNDLIRIFSMAFDLLRNFCYNHQENQLLLFEHMHIFQFQQFELGQLNLIEEIFNNNKILLVQKVDPQLITGFVQLIQKEGRQSRFLKVIEVFLSYKGKYLFDNQLFVVNALIPSELGEKEIKTLYCEGSKSNYLKFYLDDPLHLPSISFIEKLAEIDYRDTFRDEPFYFHRQLLDILIQTTLVDRERRAFQIDRGEDKVKENFNISVSKLKNLFTADYLLDLLKQKDYLIPNKEFIKQPNTLASQLDNKPIVIDEDRLRGIAILKPIVIEFLRLIHISSERGQINHSQLSECEPQIIDLFEFEAKRIEKINNIIQFSQDLQDYYMKGLLPFTLAYYDKFLKKAIEQQSSKQDIRKDMGAIERVIRLWFSRIVLLSADNSMFPIVRSSDHVKILKKCLFYYSSSFYEKLEKQLWEQQPQDEFLTALLRMKDIVDNESQNQTDQNVEIQDEIPTSKPKKKRTRQKIPRKKIESSKVFQASMPDDEKLLKGYDKEESGEVNEFWEMFLDELVGNEEFENEVQRERETVADAFINITQFLDSKYTKQVTNKPDVKSISRQLIFYLQSAFNDPNCKESIQTLLRVLQKIIENDENRQQEMQNLFDKLGATQMVLLVLSENSKLTDKKLLMSFLQFINTMLQGGNVQVQATIYKFMINFPQSENIFQKIYIIIKKQIENIEIISKSKQSGVDNALGMLQIDQKEVKEDLKLVLQVLTFLQNAVEGHYLNLQNYFRIQFNSRNNYDLTITITDLFKTYYYEGYCQKNYDNMLKCLDTLNELVQGPCPENQIAVSESKFLDIAADLFNRYQVEQDSTEIDKTKLGDEERKEVVDVTKKEPEKEFKKWMVARLMNKILNLIISLLEGREISNTNNVLKRIMRNLPITLLERHSVIEYNKYMHIYRGKYKIQVLEHLNVDPRQMKRRERTKLLQLQPTYFESILQNGFLLFFLMSNYIECDPHLLSPIVLMHKQHKKKILKQETSNFLLQFLRTSVFYLIFQFTISLFKVILDYLNSMKNLAADQLIQTDTVVPMNAEEEQKLKEIKYREDLEKAVQFYMLNSAHIDVMHENNLEVVYFIKLPLTKHLPKEKKNQFHDSVDRSTTQAKVQGLINISPTFIEVCKHEENLSRLFDRQKTIALLTNYVQLWRELAFLLTLFLNLFILFSFDGTWGDRVNDYIFFNNDQAFTISSTRTLIFIMGLVMTCLSIFVVLFFLLKNAPLILKRAWIQKGLFEGQDPNPIFKLIDLGYKMFLTVLSFLQEVEVMYYIAYGLFAIFGTFIHPFFFIFHLSEILFRYPTLKNVILSVYKPRTQLVLTFFLLFLLVYIFTLIAYVAISQNYGDYCNTLLYCFLMNIEWTFRGSIGGYLQDSMDVNNVSMTFGIGRFFFDELSNIILGVIMLNIVGGIIIDTFGSLREEESAKSQDMMDNCFICGNLKADFDRLQSKSSGGFREHIKINHYMWNYMYFISYLRWKEKTDYSGIESYVAQKLDEEDLCWVPFNQARELQGLGDNDESKQKELLIKIEDKMKYVQEQIQDMLKQLKIDNQRKN